MLLLGQNNNSHLSLIIYFLYFFVYIYLNKNNILFKYEIVLVYYPIPYNLHALLCCQKGYLLSFSLHCVTHILLFDESIIYFIIINVSI